MMNIMLLWCFFCRGTRDANRSSRYFQPEKNLVATKKRSSPSSAPRPLRAVPHLHVWPPCLFPPGIGPVICLIFGAPFLAVWPKFAPLIFNPLQCLAMPKLHIRRHQSDLGIDLGIPLLDQNKVGKMETRCTNDWRSTVKLQGCHI